MAKTTRNLGRGLPIEFVTAERTFVVQPITVGQYRAVLALDDEAQPGGESWDEAMWADLVVRQCEILAGKEVANALTPDQCQEVVVALTCQYQGIDPAAFMEMQAVLKKKAVMDHLRSLSSTTECAN